MGARLGKRRAGRLARRLDWIGFGGGLAAALVVWATWHGDVWASGFGDRQKLQASKYTGGTGQTALEEAQGGAREAAKKPPSGQGAAAPAAQPSKQTDGTAAATAGALQSGDSAGASPPPQAAQQQAALDKLLVRVYLTDEKKVEAVPLETYVRGVVAAEMPLDFEPAALEAQALAARTYIIRRLADGDRSGVPDADADVTDTQTHQVYRSQAEMASLRAPKAWAKADAAAQRTKGKILTYEGKPIDALYFSSSNGYTENSEDVYPFQYPYLRSVESPWDREIAPDWMDTREIPLQDFYQKLGAGAAAVLAKSGSSGGVRILDRTEGDRVKTLKVGNETMTGVEARDKLGLRSAAFDLTATGRNVVITTYGSGHGVGMSQWGAEAMAKRGETAEQIVRHYYTGIRIEEASKLANPLFL